MIWNELYHDYIKALFTSSILFFSINAFAVDVIHTKSKNFEDLDLISIRSIFTRKLTTWRNGQNITVFTYSLNSIEHKRFVWEWFQITNYRYKKLLYNEIYPGEINGPRIVYSDEEMMLNVALTPYSVGYLSDIDKFVLNNANSVIVISYGELF